MMSEQQAAGASPDEIRMRSYLIWEREGRPFGRDVDHWLRAEAELMKEAGKTAILAQAAPAARRSRATAGTGAPRPKRRAKT
jgi:hypothetical protein